METRSDRVMTSLITAAILATILTLASADYVCEKPSDVVFLLDTSNSIWQPDFKKQLRFVRAIINEFTVGEDNMRVGAIAFSDYPRLQFHLNRYYNKKAVKQAIGRMRQHGGVYTFTSDAIHYMRTRAFREDKGARENVTRIGIIITDGRSYDTAITAAEATLAREDGIHLFSIGVGKRVDEAELKAIASQPSDYYSFKVENYDGLKRIRELLAKKACTVTDPPTTTTTTTTTPMPTTTTTTTTEAPFTQPSLRFEPWTDLVQLPPNDLNLPPEEQVERGSETIRPPPGEGDFEQGSNVLIGDTGNGPSYGVEGGTHGVDGNVTLGGPNGGEGSNGTGSGSSGSSKATEGHPSTGSGRPGNGDDPNVGPSGQPGHFDENGRWVPVSEPTGQPGHFDENGRWVPGSGPNGQPGHFDENGRWVPGSGPNGQPGHFDENGRWVPDSGPNGQPGHFDENGRWIPGSGPNGQPGHFDENGRWVPSSGPNGQPGHFDENGRWVPGSGPNIQPGHFDENGRWVPGSGPNGQPGYVDENGRWVPGRGPNGQPGHFDENGRWVPGSGPTGQPGHFDENGRWVPGSGPNGQPGHFDENGRWVPGSGPNGQPGYFDENGRWVPGTGPNGQPGHFDKNGRWVPSTGPNGQPGHFDKNGQWVPGSGPNGQPGYVDKNGRWVPGTGPNGQPGHFDENGLWVPGTGPNGQPGHFDKNGRWVPGSGSNGQPGYVDENGRWVPGTGPHGQPGHFDENGLWVPGTGPNGQPGYFDKNGRWFPGGGQPGYYDENGRWIPGNWPGGPNKPCPTCENNGQRPGSPEWDTGNQGTGNEPGPICPTCASTGGKQHDHSGTRPGGSGQRRCPTCPEEGDGPDSQANTTDSIILREICPTCQIREEGPCPTCKNGTNTDTGDSGTGTPCPTCSKRGGRRNKDRENRENETTHKRRHQQTGENDDVYPTYGGPTYTGLGCTPEVPTDVVFVVDSKVGGDSYQRYLWNFIRDIISRINMDGDLFRVQFVHECVAVPDLRLSSFTEKSKLLQELANIIEMPRRTASLFRSMSGKIASIQTPFEERRKVGVYVTDDHSQDLDDTLVAAREAKEQFGVEVYGVGVGGAINPDELRSVASGNDRHHVYMMSHHAKLPHIARKLSRQLCIKHKSKKMRRR